MAAKSRAALLSATGSETRSHTSTYDSAGCVTSQAMEIAGGARVERDAKSSQAGVPVDDSARLASTFCEKTGADDGCGYAHWDVATARPQSRLQQLVLWKVR